MDLLKKYKSLSFFKGLIAFFLLSTVNLFASANEKDALEQQFKEASYFFCLDGGGTKTALQILDDQGKPLMLYPKDREPSLLIQGDCSNVVTIGVEKVSEVFHALFDGLEVGPSRLPVTKIIPKSLMIGGFAGVGRPIHKSAMEDVFKSFGFLSKKIIVYTDAELALELIGENGAILISGTGSICFIKDKGLSKRFGGLGYRIGDDGSGYLMGLRAIKAAIEEEYHYGKQTSLTPLIQDLFEVSSSIDLIGPINGNEESPGRIASVAPLVFQEAWKGDLVANQIVELAAQELGELLASGVRTTDIKHCLTYLIGGLFQNENANRFIQMICQSPSMQNLSKGARPVLVNLSANMVPALVVQDKLKMMKKNGFNKLASLPIVDNIIREDYKAIYNNEFVTSGYTFSTIPELSQTFYNDRLEGLKFLQKLDYSILPKVEQFIEKHYEKVTKTLCKRMRCGGRLILVGRGASGRLSVDLAAKWKEFWRNETTTLASEYAKAVEGVISGGAEAFIIPKEEFEDSEQLGYDAIAKLNLTSKDTVVITSATGTPDFHIGAAKAAHAAKALCYYFSHTEEVPQKNLDFFKQCHVRPICIDVGLQTISGTNRLQSASLSEFIWGMVLNEILRDLSGQLDTDLTIDPSENLKLLEKTWDEIASYIPDIKKVVDLEIGVFSDKDANFWKALDTTYHGYVTFLSSEDCLRDILIDIVDISPNFSSTRPRARFEKGKKKAEFRAYMLGEQPNLDCWEKMIARNIDPIEKSSISNFFLSMNEQGYGDYISRTISNKNLLIGVMSSSLSDKKALELCCELLKAKDRGLKTVMIIAEEIGYSLTPSLTSYLDQMDICLKIPNIPYDPLHLMKTLALKQVLNLISNGAMIGMNKIYGNVMIDIDSSNEEVIDRTIRIIQGIYSDHHPEAPHFDYELLYYMVARATKYKQLVETQLGKHIPSPVKVVLTMLEKDCDVEQAVAALKINNENIQLILNGV
jgi:N-acetylglucosamine kinase-like BadF-type ATPase/N-acetylmuramic acid 6-phosphate (MurNAc-6-P) etherase